MNKIQQQVNALKHETSSSEFYRIEWCQYIYVKAIPVQAWTGPEDSRRLRLPDLKTIGT